MSTQSKLLNDEVVASAEKALKAMGKNALLAKKLAAIIAAKKHGITLVSKIYSISRTTLTEWIKHVRSGAFEKLKAPPQRKRKNKIDSNQGNEIKEWITQDPQLTLEAIKVKLQAKYGLMVSRSTVQRALKKMKYSYITPRGKHVKQDPKKVEEFKKNIASDLKKIEHTRVFFFDESRFGTHSKIGHGWFQTGSRPRVKMKLGFENFYLYSSVDINDGSNFSLILPNVNTDNMNMFLSKMSEEYSNDIAILIMDGAGWHKSKDLKLPHNIRIIHLPSYAPELNPVERLWLYIKSNVLRNKLYETLDDLQLTLCNFIKALSNDVVKQICQTQYVFI